MRISYSRVVVSSFWSNLASLAGFQRFLATSERVLPILRRFRERCETALAKLRDAGSARFVRRGSRFSDEFIRYLAAAVTTAASRHENGVAPRAETKATTDALTETYRS